MANGGEGVSQTPSPFFTHNNRANAYMKEKLFRL